MFCEQRKNLESQFQKHLGEPLQDLLSRPKKAVRSQLVFLGFEIIQGHAPSTDEEIKSCQSCATAIESLHTGSLIIDDIQDLSQWRRGGPTLHIKYGLPVALNAGNWLYFHAFQNIREGVEDPMLRVQIYELMEEVLREAHLGQALDVGTDISTLNAQEIIEISMASLEMKSGALMALALLMGATVAGANPDQMQVLKNFGVGFGVSLQMFDDLGNVQVDRPTKKHLEDLSLKRPSFVWCCLAQNYPGEIKSFCDAIKNLPEVSNLREFLKQTPLLETGFQQALVFQKEALQSLNQNFKLTNNLEKQFSQIAEKVAHAYC